MKMDLILNQIIIVLNTFLIAIVPVVMGSGDFKCQVLCLCLINTVQLIFLRVFVGCLLKHRRSINSFLIVNIGLLNTVSFVWSTYKYICFIRGGA